jgi:predicted MFS family arabinose efflux permease
MSPLCKQTQFKNANLTNLPNIGAVKHRWVETWYLSYAILGCTMGGMFPILMPLLALKHFNSACHVGLLMAAFNLGGFIAPLWGKIADRYGIHRELLISSLIMTAITLTAFAFTNTFTVWLGLALIQGVSVFLAITLGNLFIVEIHPKIEWDQRIGWLQTFNSGGQVGGMLLAAALSRIDLSAGLLVAASLIALAVLPGFLTPRVSHEVIAYRPAVGSLNHHIQSNQNASYLQFSQVKLNISKHLHSVRHTPFVRIMEIWFLCVAGVSAIYTLYPVMMQEEFGVGRDRIALSFALAMGLSVFLYAQAGRLAHRFGPVRILKSFLGARLAALLLLFLLVMHVFGGAVHLILLTFVLVVLCWPFIVVSATALTADATPFDEGEGMGIFCAVLSSACLSGSALGGWLATQWGYQATVAMAVSTEALALLLICRMKQSP